MMLSSYLALAALVVMVIGFAYAADRWHRSAEFWHWMYRAALAEGGVQPEKPDSGLRMTVAPPAASVVPFDQENL
jgi:hypothetical protein